MSIEEDMLQLVLAFPAFWTPILTALPPGTLITDDIFLERLAFSQITQDLDRSKPYLYWLGPFETDVGQASSGVSGTAKARFDFYCCHNTASEAGRWAQQIIDALGTYFVNAAVYALTDFRITAAIFKTKLPMLEDQTIKTAETFPVSRCMVGYCFGYQHTDH